MEEPSSSENPGCPGNGVGGLGEAIKIPERLLKRDQERQQGVERRKEVKESQVVTEEKLDYFSCTFSTEKTAIEELLSRCSDADRCETTRVLEEVSDRVQQLQKFLNESILFLTQYELRQAQASLQKLQNALAEKREEALPRKKFAFRSRNVAVSQTKTANSVSSESQSSSSVAVAQNAGKTVMDGIISSERCGISGADSQILIMQADAIQKQDVLLTHLTNCKVKLLGAPSTLHIKHVRDSEILCGPVSSSVFVDQCSGNTLAFPCQQLRTHNTTDTRVYLHVTSRAIIEDCSGVSFAPLSWSYPGMEDDFKISGLDRSRNNWTQVDDFNWLAADTPSPNWTVIPESERRSCWD